MKVQLTLIRQRKFILRIMLFIKVILRSWIKLTQKGFSCFIATNISLPLPLFGVRPCVSAARLLHLIATDVWTQLVHCQTECSNNNDTHSASRDWAS